MFVDQLNDKEFRTVIKLATVVIARDLELDYHPEICFSEKQFNRGKSESEIMTTRFVDNAGMMMYDPPRMFIRRDNCLIHSIEAVAHELVHFKFPEMKHGKAFNEIVEIVLHARIPRVKLAKHHTE